jgi:hypothetical protein
MEKNERAEAEKGGAGGADALSVWNGFAFYA